jgi:Zn-dependent peptidase ImmA (M78 family)
LELPKPPPLPTYPDLSGEELAAAERERLRIPDGPVADLRRLIEVQGVLCFHLPVPNNEFSGLSWIHPEYGPCILINANDNPGRRAFTTAHEYGHLLRGDGDSVCDLTLEAGVEKQANRFATCFLMPYSDVIETFHRRGLSPLTLGVSEIASLSRRYGVSLEAMSFRLRELGLAAEGVLHLPLDAPPSKYFGRFKPKWRRRLGETFVSVAIEAYDAGRISAGKLAHYLGIDIRQALDVVEKGRAQKDRDGT